MGFFTNLYYHTVLFTLTLLRNILYYLLLPFKSQLGAIIAKRLYAETGIRINGSKPTDFQVKDERLYPMAISGGIIGMKQAFLLGYLDCEDLAGAFTQIFSSKYLLNLLRPDAFLTWLEASVINLQSVDRAFQIAEQHYNMGNDFFEAVLGETMAYTCGYWPNPKMTLDEAQYAKFELIARKMKLKPGMRVMDIGCGWGTFAKYLATKHKVKVVGITISTEQAKYARALNEGIPGVEIRITDYRLMNEKFDRITATGLFEHMGSYNYLTFYSVVARCLVDDGIFVNHHMTIFDPIIVNQERYHPEIAFINGELPRIADMSKAIQNAGLVIEDMHNFGPYYDPTLMAWWDLFEKAWPKLQMKYPPTMYRWWRGFCCSGAALHRSRKVQLLQTVLSKGGLSYVYVRPVLKCEREYVEKCSSELIFLEIYYLCNLLSIFSCNELLPPLVNMRKRRFQYK